jgi:hypothetical protein
MSSHQEQAMSIEHARLVAAILIESDPLRLYFEDVDNRDEYDSEASRIAEQLGRRESADDCQRLAWEIFRESFAADHAGPLDRYREVGQRLWDLASSRNAR